MEVMVFQKHEKMKFLGKIDACEDSDNPDHWTRLRGLQKLQIEY
jgi:hypothetical protein